MIGQILDKLNSYGIESLIIGVLLILLFYIIKLFINKFQETVTKMLKSFSEANEKLREEQINERRDWISSQERRDARLSQSLDQLASAFREEGLRKKYMRHVQQNNTVQSNEKVARTF